MWHSALSNSDPRITALRLDRNGGPARARNVAISASRAPFLTALDSDDFLEPGRLKTLVSIAEEGDWDFVADDLYRVSSTNVDGERTRLWSTSTIGNQAIDFGTFVRGNLTTANGSRGELGFLKPLMRHTFLSQHGLEYPEEMRLGEDFALYAQALLRGAKFCLTDPAGYVAVMRPDSLSGKHSARDLGALAQADEILFKHPTLAAEDRKALREHWIDTLKRWHWMRMIDAVKARKPLEALSCFVAPPAVGISLVGNLLEQAYVRTARVFGLGRPPEASQQ